MKIEKEQFQNLYEKSKNVRCDFHALEDIIEESKLQRKNLIELKKLTTDMCDKFMEMNLLNIEMQNSHKVLKIEVEQAKNYIQKILTTKMEN